MGNIITPENNHESVILKNIKQDIYYTYLQ
jgi:hypothetical protein